MYELLFYMKRGFQSALHFLNRVLARYARPGLTCARADMLRAIEESSGLFQSALKRKLGVTAQTISRMIRSLEKLGFVTRKPSRDDKRQIVVDITSAGLDALEDTWDYTHVRTLHLARNMALVPNQWGDDEAGIAAMRTMQQWLHRVRAFFDDGGTLFFRWFPDDFG